jgi:Tfp pilus assembly protein PilX
VPSRPLSRACSRLRALRRLARGEEGSFLVEALVSSVIIVIVGIGVLESIDRSSRLGGEQKAQAIAGNVAQSEQEQVRAMALSQQSNLRRSSSRTVSGVRYDIASRTDWVNDQSGGADCATAAASADYMKLSTVVTWPAMGTRKPVTLESLIAPGVRSFGAGQGSLAVLVTNAAGAGVSGLQVSLSGPATLSDTTNASGCVLWGYLPAASGYVVGFSRPPDWVAADGSQVVSRSVPVVGDQTSNVALQYDRGGYLQASFQTKRTSSATATDTYPKHAHVTNSGGGGVSVSFPLTGSSGTSGLLFPFTSAYTVHADRCAATEVPVPAPAPTPPFPAAPSATSATVSSGTTTPAAPMRIPAVNLKVTSGGVPVNAAAVRVITPCGTTLRRTTTSDGFVDDPGFPYATSLAFCVSDGVRSREVTQSNTNFNGSTLTVDIRSTDPTGACA